MAELISGQTLAEKITQELTEKIGEQEKKPKLKIFLIGNDPSSQIYVAKKKEFCQRVGLPVTVEKLPEDSSLEIIKEKIQMANQDLGTSAILVQLPLPKHLSEKEILSLIKPQKDVDCLHPENFGLFCQYGETGCRVLPATALAVMMILKERKVNLSGQEVVMIGNSNIVGKPLAMMLSEAGATVVICQKETRDLSQHTLRADIVITATGVRGLIKGNMIKKGAGVIDIGITREGKKIFGDVDFVSVESIAGWITPVPGGVGPVTVAVLAENVLKLREQN